MDRNLRSISTDDVENQFKTFLQRLYSVNQYRTCKDLEDSDPKQIIKYFMEHRHLYKDTELVVQATSVLGIKLSVESIAESYISVYNQHNSDIRPIKEKTEEDKLLRVPV